MVWTRGRPFEKTKKNESLKCHICLLRRFPGCFNNIKCDVVLMRLCGDFLNQTPEASVLNLYWAETACASCFCQCCFSSMISSNKNAILEQQMRIITGNISTGREGGWQIPQTSCCCIYCQGWKSIPNYLANHRNVIACCCLSPVVTWPIWRSFF